MKFIDHIDLEERDGQCALIVGDTELFDFLDDLFTERGLDAMVIHGLGKYQLRFSSVVSRATIHRLLSEVGEAEIERIAGINSDTSEA